MQYVSTRGKAPILSFDDVLLSGLARDGGLYIPKEIPKLSAEGLRSLKGKSFSEQISQIMYLFMHDCISLEALYDIVDRAYKKFDHVAVAPLSQIQSNHWLLELYHGPTFSFKDYALQVVGELFDHVLKKRNENILIVGATSGDTGSAGIEAVRNCENVKIAILFPEGRVSDVQRKQMTTIDAPNVLNLSVEGTFDDCQDIVKTLFNDHAFRDQYHLSAINSINWARILVQTAYYVATAINLGAPEQEIVFSVPTGNFGNILAAWYAKSMGVPIKHLICASNQNDILTRYFETGTMEMEEVKPSFAPSMDIQISSNFERLAYYALSENPTLVDQYMQNFKDDQKVNFGKRAYDLLKQDISAYRLDDVGILHTIRTYYKATGLVIDPHTACAYFAAKQWQKQNPKYTSPIVTVSTAHPAKFNDAVIKAIGTPIFMPRKLQELKDKPEKLQTIPADIAQVKTIITDWI